MHSVAIRDTGKPYEPFLSKCMAVIALVAGTTFLGALSINSADMEARRGGSIIGGALLGAGVGAIFGGGRGAVVGAFAGGALGALSKRRRSRRW